MSTPQRTSMLYINSANRDIDSVGPGDFRVTFGNSLVQGSGGETLSVEVTDVCMNRSWYTVNSTNDVFMINNVAYSLPVGYYTVASLRSSLSVILPTWIIAYDGRTNKFLYTAPTDTTSYTFSFQSQASSLFGFGINDTPTIAAGATLQSYLPIKVNLESSVLIHCDLQKIRCAALDNTLVSTSISGVSAFRESDILISVGIDVPPFSNILYTSSGTGIYSADLSQNTINRLRIWVTDELGNPLALQYDYSLALKLVFTSKTENSMDSYVKQLANDVRLMILSDPKKYSTSQVGAQDEDE